MRLSKLTISLGLFIVISASFMRQVLDFFYAHLGRETTTAILGAVFILIFLIITYRTIKRPINPAKKVLFLTGLLLGLYLSWRLKIVAERVHIVEYGFLAYFSARDLLKESFNFKAILLTVAAVAFFAFLDEGFQYFLPYRVCDIRDVAFNMTGGIWGGALFLIRKKAKT